MTVARKLWTDEHQRQLKAARLASGVSDVAFARDNAMALRQLQQLEEGGSSAFYSESIKYDTGSKLLKRLGVELATVVELPPPAATTPAPVLTSVHTPVPTSAPDQPQLIPATDAGHKASRVSYVGLSLVGLALIGASISLIPSIHQPGATHGVAQRGSSAGDATTTASNPPSVPNESDKPSDAAVSSEVEAPGRAETSVSPPPPLSASCAEQAGSPQTIMPSNPSKSADYVYVTAVSDVTFCVRDAAGRITRKTLQGGQSVNVTGQQPFEITADQLQQLRVFFQGQRIWFQADTTWLRLTAATPADGSWPPIR